MQVAAETVIETIEDLYEILMGYARANARQYQRGDLPPLYKANVRYQREPRLPNGGRANRWLTVRQIYRKKRADCEDLAAARCGELIAKGEDARIDIKYVRPGLFHIRVKREDGSIEDPSAILGMGKET